MIEEDGNYEHNLHCRWTILIEREKEIHLLLKFGIEPDEDCRNDYIKVNISAQKHKPAACTRMEKEIP